MGDQVLAKFAFSAFKTGNSHRLDNTMVGFVYEKNVNF